MIKHEVQNTSDCSVFFVDNIGTILDRLWFSKSGINKEL